MIPDVPAPLRIHAVILAAGRGDRMGGPKALLTLDGETFLARCARCLHRPGVTTVVAVLGHEAERVTREAGLPPHVGIVENTRYAEGMLTSILAGLEAAEAAGADAALIHPVDHPLIDADTVDAVVAAIHAGAIIAVPSHDRRRGHPAGFARASWPALRAAAPEEGARGVLARHPEWITHLPAGPNCLTGVNTPDDYRRLLGG
jgi:CTP:molybdopterin cytidylyltransferase MocA